MSYTLISDEVLKHLKGMSQLQNLKLYKAVDITDKGLEYLEELPNLQLLIISSPSVTAAGIQNLKKKMPKLNITQ